MEDRVDPASAKPNLHYTAGALLQNPTVHQIRLRHKSSAHHHPGMQYQIFHHLYHNLGATLFLDQARADN